jgi:hypothetical protein
MGIFNRIKDGFSKSKDEVDNICNKLKELSEKEKGFAALFLCKKDDEKSIFVKGNGSEIGQMLLASARNNDEFKDILIKSAMILSYPVDDDNKKIKPRVVELPNGDRALAIDANNIDSLSEEDIDKIINEIIDSVEDDESKD